MPSSRIAPCPMGLPVCAPRGALNKEKEPESLERRCFVFSTHEPLGSFKKKKNVSSLAVLVLAVDWTAGGGWRGDLSLFHDLEPRWPALPLLINDLRPRKQRRKGARPSARAPCASLRSVHGSTTAPHAFRPGDPCPSHTPTPAPGPAETGREARAPQPPGPALRPGGGALGQPPSPWLPPDVQLELPSEFLDLEPGAVPWVLPPSRPACQQPAQSWRC